MAVDSASAEHTITLQPAEGAPGDGAQSGQARNKWQRAQAKVNHTQAVTRQFGERAGVCGSMTVLTCHLAILQAQPLSQTWTELFHSADRQAPRTHLPGNVQGIDLKRSAQEWAWLGSHFADDCAIFCIDFSPNQVTHSQRAQAHRWACRCCPVSFVNGIAFSALQVSVRSHLEGPHLAAFLESPRPKWST